jgi:hypothetical protein
VGGTLGSILSLPSWLDKSIRLPPNALMPNRPRRCFATFSSPTLPDLRAVDGGEDGAEGETSAALWLATDNASLDLARKTDGEMRGARRRPDEDGTGEDKGELFSEWYCGRG